jgi:hypothetical protein
MDPDDSEYRRNVRNMSIVLAAIVIIALGAIFIPPYVFQSHNVFVSNVSETYASGFVLHLSVNSTTVTSSQGVLVSGWVNSSSATIVDINASNSWGLPPANLWGRVCTNGWPIGIGVMRGHYTSLNYTQGILLPIPRPLVSCPVQSGTPKDFVFKPHSSVALVTIGVFPKNWDLRSSFVFWGSARTGGQLQPGIYTAVLADEWGDVLPLIFRVT